MEAFFNHSVKEELSFSGIHMKVKMICLLIKIEYTRVSTYYTCPTRQACTWYVAGYHARRTPEIMVEDEQLLPHYRDRSLTHIINGTICACIKR